MTSANKRFRRQLETQQEFLIQSKRSDQKVYIYVSINGKQVGPFEEEAVLAQLASGNLSVNDMAIRQGGMGWTRLGDMFAGRLPVRPAVRPSPVVQFPPQPNPPQYSNTDHAPNYGGFLQRLALIIGARVIVILIISAVSCFLSIAVLIFFWFFQFVGLI